MNSEFVNVSLFNPDTNARDSKYFSVDVHSLQINTYCILHSKMFANVYAYVVHCTFYKSPILPTLNSYIHDANIFSMFFCDPYRTHRIVSTTT